MNARVHTAACGLIASCLGPFARAPGKLRLLAFHSLAEGDNPLLHLRPELFEAQIRFLADQGYATLRLSDLVDQWPAVLQRDRLVALTFDDGLLNQWTVAGPLLQRHKMTATFFVPAAFVGDDHRPPTGPGMASYRDLPLLSRADLRDMVAAGFEIGSHTCNHVHMKKMTPGQARDEAELSKKILEDALGRPVRSFAYPYGHTDAFAPWTRDVLAHAGFDSACTMMGGRLTPHSDLLELPRNGINGLDGLQRFQMKLRGDFDCLKWFCNR